VPIRWPITSILYHPCSIQGLTQALFHEGWATLVQKAVGYNTVSTQSSGNEVNIKNIKTIGKHGEVVEKPLYKCISERLMHVAAWYHGTLGQSSRNSKNKFRLTRLPTLPNFVALRQKVCEISVMEKCCFQKSRPKFTLGHQICHQSIGISRVSIDTL